MSWVYGLLMVGGLVVWSVDGRRTGFPQRIGAETYLVARSGEGGIASWQKTLAETGLSERFLPLPLVRGGFCSLRVCLVSVFCHALWWCVGVCGRFGHAMELTRFNPSRDLCIPDV